MKNKVVNYKGTDCLNYSIPETAEIAIDFYQKKHAESIEKGNENLKEICEKRYEFARMKAKELGVNTSKFPKHLRNLDDKVLGMTN